MAEDPQPLVANETDNIPDLIAAIRNNNVDDAERLIKLIPSKDLKIALRDPNNILHSAFKAYLNNPAIPDKRIETFIQKKLNSQHNFNGGKRRRHRTKRRPHKKSRKSSKKMRKTRRYIKGGKTTSFSMINPLHSSISSSIPPTYTYNESGQDLVKDDFYDLGTYGGVLKSIEKSRKDEHMIYLTFSPIWSKNSSNTRYTLIPGEKKILYYTDRENSLKHIVFTDGAQPYIEKKGSYFPPRFTQYRSEFGATPRL